MIPYVLLFFTVAIIAPKIKKEKFTILDIILITILVCFAGFRFGIGTDYKLYELIYMNSYNVQDVATNRTGKGFTYLISFFLRSGISYQLFLLFCSFITVTSFYRFYKKNSNNPGLAILLYVSLGFYIFAFNGFRQMLSISLLLNAIMLKQNKRRISPIILYVLAFVLHSSSLVGIISYTALMKFKNKKIDFKKIIPFFILILLLYDTAFNIFVNTFSQYGMYINYKSEAGLGTYLMVFIYYAVYILILYPNRKKIINNNENINLFFNLITIGLCIMLIQLKNWLFIRMAIYFIIFFPIILAEFYKEKEYRYKKMNSLIFYIIIFIYFLIYVYFFDGVYPYRSIITSFIR